MKRREFITKTAKAGAFLGLIQIPIINTIANQTNKPEIIEPKEFTKLPNLKYENINHSKPNWKNISEGMDFTRIEVYKGKELVDIIATVKIDPKKNDLTLYNGFEFNKNKTGTDYEKTVASKIEDWQKLTKETVMINGTQYQGDPYYYRPCALVMGNKVTYTKNKYQKKYQKKLGPKKNKAVRGMIVGQPKDNTKPNIDLLDFKYDTFDYETTPYTHGAQHWMMLLDRKGNIRVHETDWQANRTVVAKDWDNNIILMTTEGGYFTLKNYGRFLKDSNNRNDKGLNIHTAMNMDGGYEANMAISSNKLRYLTYGEFETYGPNKDASVFGRKIRIPGVLGISKKK